MTSHPPSLRGAIATRQSSTPPGSPRPSGARDDDQPIVAVDPRYFRPTEVETLLGDPSKAKNKLVQCCERFGTYETGM
jgi:GDPmannose 4,6-dehydratase